MSQDQLWDLFKMVQSERVSLDEIKADTSATLQKITALEDRVGKLEGEVSISKNANVLLKNEVCRLERKILADNQYGRLENIEISGIPKSILQYELIDIVIGIASDIDVELEPADISACHRLGGERGRGDVIVRFVNRRAADDMFGNAKKLNGMDLSDLLGPNHKPVFVNANLSPELKAMRWKAKKMKEAGLVARFGTTRRGVYVQREDRGTKVPVFIDGDLSAFLGGTPLADVLGGASPRRPASPMAMDSETVTV